MRETVYVVLATIGGTLTHFVGGYDVLFRVLCIFLCVDYLFGVLVAWVFKNSTKTADGKVDSKVSFRGLCKKFAIIVMVGVANMLDMVLGTDFIRGGVVVAYMTNELLSIIENIGLMGVPVPDAFIKAIDVMKERDEK